MARNPVEVFEKRREELDQLIEEGRKSLGADEAILRSASEREARTRDWFRSLASWFGRVLRSPGARERVKSLLAQYQHALVERGTLTEDEGRLLHAARTTPPMPACVSERPLGSVPRQSEASPMDRLMASILARGPRPLPVPAGGALRLIVWVYNIHHRKPKRIRSVARCMLSHKIEAAPMDAMPYVIKAAEYVRDFVLDVILSRDAATSKPRGAPPQYDPVKDKKLVQDYKSSESTRGAFERERGLPAGSVKMAQDRIRHRT